MTRRDFFWTAAATGVLLPSQTPLIVPVRRVMDTRTRCTPQQFRHFWYTIWPEAVRDFSRCGIQLQCTDAKGEIRLSAADRPIFTGLEPGVINMVITDRIPRYWDKGRGLAGVTTLYEGYHLSVIALSRAHGHHVPFFSVNTCVHELLHALLQDVFLSRPTALQVNEHEFRDDCDATRLWLFHDGAAIRESARVYLNRLRSGIPKS
jgi:hypothetical protein